MSTTYYGPGELSSGFVGWRTHVRFNNKSRQFWFSTKTAINQDDTDCVYKRARLMAEIKDAELMAESALFQYTVFVTQNHPTTKPYRGVGVHGITLRIKDGTPRYRNKERWEPLIDVWYTNQGKRHHREFTFYSQTFSQAWENAVRFWGAKQEILAEDIERVIANPPAPSQFKDLRQQMNQEFGNATIDRVPVQALEPVFREQREAFARRKAVEEHPMDVGNKVAEAEIASWFRSARMENQRNG